MSYTQKLKQLGSFLNLLIFKQKTEEERNSAEWHFKNVVETIDDIEQLKQENETLKAKIAELEAAMINSDYVLAPRDLSLELMHDLHFEQIKYERSGQLAAGLVQKLYETIIKQCDKGDSDAQQ